MKNNDERLQRLYDPAAATYDEMVRRTEYVGTRWFIENLPDGVKSGGKKILDLGCANGINIVGLHGINREITATGVDVSSRMIEEARKTGLYKKLLHQNLDDGLAFSDSAVFDLVLAFGCLEFVNDLAACLGEISRVLRKGGYFCASFQR